MNPIKKILQLFANVRITVVCLLWLFILTFWGTVAQVSHGLYSAQERYFYSFFFLAGKFFPLPGGQLTLWILGVNLISSAVVHFSRLRHWRFVGLKISHLGMLIYFAAAFVTFQVTRESNVHLAEGQGVNYSSSYQTWELAFWPLNKEPRDIKAIELTHAKAGDVLPFNEKNFSIEIQKFYQNSAAFMKTLDASGIKPVNGSGITLIQPKDVLIEREKNIAGGLFTVKSEGKPVTIALYGAESTPTVLTIQGTKYAFSLRRTRSPLPFTIRLDRFKVEFYPGTQTAKTYESFVTLFFDDGSSREAHIYMNNPLRYKDYAFYQASYDIDDRGKAYSTLAVVRNSGRLLPYIACFVVFIGLSVHFIIMAFYRRFNTT